MIDPRATAALKGTIYLSGPITGVPDFKLRFRVAEETVRTLHQPHRILSPVIFPAGWTYDHYMEHCLIMVRRSTAVIMLPDWQASPGARTERTYAQSLKIPIFNLPPRS